MCALLTSFNTVYIVCIKMYLPGFQNCAMSPQNLIWKKCTEAYELLYASPKKQRGTNLHFIITRIGDKLSH